MYCNGWKPLFPGIGIFIVEKNAACRITAKIKRCRIYS
jgi:hypothetical protein